MISRTANHYVMAERSLLLGTYPRQQYDTTRVFFCPHPWAEAIPRTTVRVVLSRVSPVDPPWIHLRDHGVEGRVIANLASFDIRPESIFWCRVVPLYTTDNAGRVFP